MSQIITCVLSILVYIFKDSVTSDKLDLTALVRVLKNTVLDEPLSGYGSYPKDDKTSFTDDVIRLVLTRNKLEHTGYRNLEDHECEKISHSLKEVGNFIIESITGSVHMYMKEL